MDENDPSLDVQDRRFDKKDPAFDEIHSAFDDFISGPEDGLPDFEEFTSTSFDRGRRGIKDARRRRNGGLPEHAAASASVTITEEEGS